MTLTMLLSLAGVFACRSEPPPPNVLVVLLDDIGLDGFAMYEEGDAPAPTPVIDDLASRGMRFDHAYAYPVCAASRAALLTGRFGRRHGFGNNIPFNRFDHALPQTELSIAEMVHTSPLAAYHTAVYGKWHLLTRSREPVVQHAWVHGFDRSAFTVANIETAYVNEPVHAHDYFHWEEIVDGEVQHIDGYHPTHTVDRVLDDLRAVESPWFIYLPLHNAHIPLHVPPMELQSVAGPDETDERVLFQAMVQAADTEIGRLLDALDEEERERTYVIVIGDNGTDGRFLPDGWSVVGGKGSLHDGRRTRATDRPRARGRRTGGPSRRVRAHRGYLCHRCRPRGRRRQHAATPLGSTACPR